MSTRILLVLLCSLAFAPVALAQEEQPQTAAALLVRGIELRQQRNDLDALSLFQRAHELVPSRSTAAYLGFNEHALGLFTEAEQHLVEALGHEGDPEDIPPELIVSREPIETSLANLRAQLGTISILAQPPAILVLGGREYPTPIELRVPAGEVEIEVRLNGYVTQRLNITVTPDTLAQRLVRLAEAAPEPPQRVDSDEPSREPWEEWWFWTTIGAVVVSAGTAIGVGVALSADPGVQDPIVPADGIFQTLTVAW